MRRKLRSFCTLIMLSAAVSILLTVLLVQSTVSRFHLQRRRAGGVGGSGDKPALVVRHEAAELLQRSLPAVEEVMASFRRHSPPPLNTAPGSVVNTILEDLSWLEDLSGLEVPTICNAAAPFVLAVVPSAVDHLERRQLIRDTWANPAHYVRTGLRAVFVLGATNNDTLQELVEQEMDEHQDVIQNHFLDTYRNLTYKTISWLSWTQEWCPATPFIAKVDDDVVVNPFHLFKYLADRLERDPESAKIIGIARSKLEPMRGLAKWAATTEEYPYDFYPDFVLGPSYIVGRNAVDRLLQYVPYVPFYFLEDVFTTGMVAGAANVSLVQAEKLLYTKRLTRRLYTGKVVFYIEAEERKRNRAWPGIIRHAPKSSPKNVYRDSGNMVHEKVVEALRDMRNIKN